MTPSDSLTLHLDQQVNRWLVRARADDGIPASERIRAGLMLWHADRELTEQINALAATMRSATVPSTGADRVKLRIALDPGLRQLLIDARADDSIPTSVRVRAVVQLWHDDPAVRDLIDATATALRRNRLAGSAATLAAAGASG